MRKQRRAFRVRKKVHGTADRPRLSVFRSHRHMECQIIDDTTGRTLVAASSRDQDLRDQTRYGGNCAAAQLVGRAVAQKALQAGITAVRFDRGGNRFHGRTAALASAAREAGLQF
jgi:large subunit ribosomal protein L18